jgi:hypothetical protein
LLLRQVQKLAAQIGCGSVVIDDDAYRTRRALTFAQAEGKEPLSSQLKRTEVSAELASRVWSVVYQEIQTVVVSDILGNAVVADRWAHIWRDFQVLRLHRPVDEVTYRSNGPTGAVERIKKIIYSSRYVEFYDFLQFVLRHRDCPFGFASNISNCLAAREARRKTGQIVEPGGHGVGHWSAKAGAARPPGRRATSTRWRRGLRRKLR